MLVEHLGVELLKLVLQQFVLALDVVGVARHHEEQKRVALDVAQEAQTESLAFACSLDDSRDVCHHERLVVAVVDDAERRFERGERVVGNLRACARHG